MLEWLKTDLLVGSEVRPVEQLTPAVGVADQVVGLKTLVGRIRKLSETRRSRR